MKCFISSLIITFIVTTTNSYEASRCKKKMIIDHDAGADDAEAILLALLYEKYFDGPCVVALTVTFGNVNLTQGIINTERILELSNRTDIPIYAGAEGPIISGRETDRFFGEDGLGDEEYQLEKEVKVEELAATALIDFSKKYEGDLIVVSIGPATNIALAIMLDPGFVNRLSQLYHAGGNIPSQRNRPEFNTAMDPEAYYIITEAAIVNKVYFIPSSKNHENLSRSKEWRKNILGVIPTPIIQALNRYQRISFKNSKEATYLDPAVVAIALDPNITQEFKDSYSSGILCGNDRGITVYNFSLPDSNLKIFFKGDSDIYKQFLIDVFSAELND